MGLHCVKKLDNSILWGGVFHILSDFCNDSRSQRVRFEIMRSTYYVNSLRLVIP